MWVPPEINQSNPKILLVGRDPGTQEMVTGRPFVDPAGQLLDKLLGSAGLRRADLAVTNVVGVQPPGNTFQRHSKEDVEKGLTQLEALVKRLRPNLIVALGNEAAWACVEDWPGVTIQQAHSIQERRGYVWSGRWGTKVLTTLHPASVLHAGAEQERGINAHIAKALLGMDLKKAATAAKWADITRPRREVRFVTSGWEAEQAAKVLLAAPLVGCDIEVAEPRTTSCIGFAPNPSLAYVFTPAVRQEALALLTSPRLRTVFHNGSFDLHFLWSRYGTDVVGYAEDTIVAFHAMWPEIAGKAEDGGGKRTHKSLKFLASLYTNDEWWKDYSFASPEEEWTLNGMDCMVTLDCWQKMKPYLRSMEVEAIYRHEMSLIRPLAKVSARGLLVDEELRQERLQALGARAAAVETDLARLAEPALIAARASLSKPALLWQRKVCPCCRNGAEKRVACWSCAGLDKKPGKKAAIALEMCRRCEGRGEWEEFTFNPNSNQQVAMLLYDALKLPPRHNEGRVTVDETAVKTLLAAVRGADHGNA